MFKQNFDASPIYWKRFRLFRELLSKVIEMMTKTYGKHRNRDTEPANIYVPM